MNTTCSAVIGKVLRYRQVTLRVFIVIRSCNVYEMPYFFFNLRECVKYPVPVTRVPLMNTCTTIRRVFVI